MIDKSYRPYGLEPIETASRDEIAALQTERLKWSLAHAYENVAAYRKKFDDAGVHPRDFKSLEDLGKFPFTAKQDLRDNYPVRHVRGAAGQGGAHPCVLRHDRQADRGRLYPERYRYLGRRDGALDPGVRRPAGHEGRMFPMATACLPAAWAPITAPKSSAAP